VIQKPGTDFTVSGSTLTFTTAPAANTSFFAILLGSDNGGTVTPTDGSVTGDKLASNIAITTSGDISFDGGSFVFNESSADKDFRIESNGNTSMLHVDGGNDRVLVGSSTGAADFHVKVATNDTNAIIENTSHNTILQILCANTTKNSVIEFGDGDDDDVGSIDYDHNTNEMDFTVNAKRYMRITDDGLFKFSKSETFIQTAQFHEFTNTNGNQQILYLRHEDNSNPYGLQVQFNAVAPDDNTHWFLSCSDTGAGRCIIYSDGDVKNHDNSYGAISDERIKQDIRDSNSQWEDIKAVKVRNFKKKDDVRQYGDKALEQIGVIAQELEDAGMDKLIKESDPTPADILSDSSFGTLYEDGDTIPEDKKIGDIKEIKTTVKGVSYSVLYMKAIKALQEAMAKIETLEADVKTLKGE